MIEFDSDFEFEHNHDDVGDLFYFTIDGYFVFIIFEFIPMI